MNNIETCLQEYKKLLKFCTPKRIENAPDNLLALLNEAYNNLQLAIKENSPE